MPKNILVSRSDRRQVLLGLVLGATLAIPMGQAQAQEFPPKKTISMVVGFVPGGAADTGARIIAKKLGENLGVAVTVENKAGAGGNIGTDLVARAVAADHRPRRHQITQADMTKIMH